MDSSRVSDVGYRISQISKSASPCLNFMNCGRKKYDDKIKTCNSDKSFAIIDKSNREVTWERQKCIPGKSYFIAVGPFFSRKIQVALKPLYSDYTQVVTNSGGLQTSESCFFGNPQT